MPVNPPICVEAEMLIRELKSGRNRGVIITARGPAGMIDCVVKVSVRWSAPRRQG
jgi:hypothetical protein